MDSSDEEVLDFCRYVDVAKSFRDIKQTNTVASVSMPLIPSTPVLMTSTPVLMTSTNEDKFDPYPWIKTKLVIPSDPLSSKNMGIYITKYMYNSARCSCVEHDDCIASQCDHEVRCIHMVAMMLCTGIVVLLLILTATSSYRIMNGN
jgi:hypothetical protein